MSAVLSRGRLLAAMAALALAFALALGVYTSSASAVDKVLVCHATSSETNPFNAIIVDDNSTELEGHLEHEGDFISDVENPEQLTDEEAEAICDAGPPTTTTTTTGPPATTTTTTGPPATTTTTTGPPATTTTTTGPPATTTTGPVG